MNYVKVTVSVQQVARIIYEANNMINQGNKKEAEQKVQEMTNIQPKVTVIPIYGGVYCELQVDA